MQGARRTCLGSRIGMRDFQLRIEPQDVPDPRYRENPT